MQYSRCSCPYCQRLGSYQQNSLYRRNADVSLRELERIFQTERTEENFSRWFNAAHRAQHPSADAYRCDVPSCPQHTAGTRKLIHCTACPNNHKVCFGCAAGLVYDELQNIELPGESHHYMEECNCRCHKGIPGWSEEKTRYVCTNVLALAIRDEAGRKGTFKLGGRVGSCATILNPNALPGDYPSADDPGSTVQCTECAYYNCPLAQMREAEATTESADIHDHPDWDYSNHPEDEYDDGWGW